MMKKSVVILSLLFVVLSIYAVDADVLSYNGAGSEIPSNSLLVNFEIDSEQALRTTQKKTGTQTELFWFGFYSAEDDLADGTLTFNENPGTMSESNGVTSITYTATATFDYYVYILSNNTYTLKLWWTDLQNSGKTKSISYTVNDNSGTSSNKYTLCTSNPTAGIFYSKSGQLSAKTSSYTISVDNSANVEKYTGTMTLVLESES